MKLTRQQRINNLTTNMVTEVTSHFTIYRERMTKGIDLPGEQDYPALKATGDEIREALGENAKKFEILCDFVLDGKSNKITKK